MLLGKWHIKPGLAFNSLLPIKLVFNNTSILSQSFTHLLFLFTPDSVTHGQLRSGLASLQVCADWTPSISRDNHGHGPHRCLHLLISFSFSHSHLIRKKKKIHHSSTIYSEDSINISLWLSEQNFYNTIKNISPPIQHTSTYCSFIGLTLNTVPLYHTVLNQNFDPSVPTIKTFFPSLSPFPIHHHCLRPNLNSVFQKLFQSIPAQISVSSKLFQQISIPSIWYMSLAEFISCVHNLFQRDCKFLNDRDKIYYCFCIF